MKIGVKGMKTTHTSNRQAGVSLVEVLVAMTISLVVTGAMVVLMSNSLSSTSRIVKMTKLTDDLRTAMHVMSRDVRRSNYTADAVLCFGNPDCGTDGSVALPGDVTISAGNDCFTFLTDRDHDGDATENDAGGFRLITSNGVGLLQMWVGGASPDCAASDANWANLTNPDDMEITAFSVDDDLSYTEVVYDNGFGLQSFQKVRKLRMSVDGRLVVDNDIHRSIADVIKLRNNIYF